MKLEIVIEIYENCISVDLRRGKKGMTLRLYPENTNETEKSAIQFADALAEIVNADWKIIDRSNIQEIKS